MLFGKPFISVDNVLLSCGNKFVEFVTNASEETATSVFRVEDNNIVGILSTAKTFNLNSTRERDKVYKL
jgi:hypothetical protein